MSSDTELFQVLTGIVKTTLPKFSHRWKAKVWIYKVIGPVVGLFNKRFLTDYITTLYPHVDWPQEHPENDDWTWKVFGHEFVHLSDTKRLSLRYVLAYGFPQIFTPLALLAFLAFWKIWFLVCLSFLLCVAPWPAPGRTWAELRGYTMSMAVNLWRYGDVQETTIDWIVPQFTGWAYYRMCPNEKKIRDQLTKAVQSVRDGSILTPPENEPFRVVYQMLKDRGETVI